MVINLRSSQQTKQTNYFSYFDSMVENQTLPLDFSKTFYSHQAHSDLSLHMSTEQAKKVLQDKDNEMNKAIVPIKEYSNKFLRSVTYKPKAEPPGRKINTQQRFNLILKKKNALGKNLPKENHSKIEEHLTESQQNQALIKVSRLYNSRREKIKTEASASHAQNNFSQFEMLDSSIFNLIAPTSNLLNLSAKSRFFDENHKEVQLKRNKSISIKNLEKKQKISQSRGLELFSKIFVRNKDEMYEKVQKRCKNQRSAVSKFYQVEQNFETRKITPIIKNKKAKILLETYRPKQRSLKKYYTIENNDQNQQELFELNGWQTTI